MIATVAALGFGVAPGSPAFAGASTVAASPPVVTRAASAYTLAAEACGRSAVRPWLVG